MMFNNICYTDDAGL